MKENQKINVLALSNNISEAIKMLILVGTKEYMAVVAHYLLNNRV
jgi:hypothetical protein